ncbi:hypothetical protein D3C73_381670 [compost metagenome]
MPDIRKNNGDHRNRIQPSYFWNTNRGNDRVKSAFIPEEAVQAKRTHNFRGYPTCQYNCSNNTPKHFIFVLHQESDQESQHLLPDHGGADQED